MRDLRRDYSVGVLAVLLSVVAAQAEPPARDHDIVPEDYFTLATIASCEISPDGKYVAYTELRWDEEADTRNTDLWVVDCETKRRQRLTFDIASDGSPTWSPDGRYIYFASGRKRGSEDGPPYDGKRQVWRVSPAGGDLFPVTRVKDGIGQFDLSKDGRSLYYAVSDKQYDEAFKKLRKKHKHLEYGHGVVEYTQIWRLDLESWRANKIVDKQRVIREFEVLPDESAIAMITTPDDTLLTNEGWSRVDVFDGTSGEVRIITKDGWRAGHPSPYGWVGNLACSSDGKLLAWTIDFDGYPGEIYVANCRGDGAEPWRLDRPGEVTVTGNLRWNPGSTDLVFTGEDHARQHVYSLSNVDPSRRHVESAGVMTPGDFVIHNYSVSEDGRRLAVVKSDTRSGRDIYLGGCNGEAESGKWSRLTDVNPQIDTWKLPQISLVQWNAPDGTEVEGILELPPDYKPGKPLPMVVELHGGPTAATMYRMRFWIYGRTLMAAKGYALLSPNYRGSTGYGDKFLTGLVGHENDIEVKDILAGVDAMVERGIADPDRLAVMGWSNGGFLTNCLITQTTRFKAASSGAGILDMVLQWGSEDTPGHVINFMQGLPWETPDKYRHSSPAYALDKVKTPTLVHVGGSDPRCPPAHSKGLYRALKYYVGVDTELVVYPGASHGLTKYKDRLAKMEWDLAWFEKYLGAEPAAKDAGETDEVVESEPE
ncbi:MAG: S9 family peptidase [Planctomycetota bacterium]